MGRVSAGVDKMEKVKNITSFIEFFNRTKTIYRTSSKPNNGITYGLILANPCHCNLPSLNRIVQLFRSIFRSKIYIGSLFRCPKCGATYIVESEYSASDPKANHCDVIWVPVSMDKWIENGGSE